RKKAREENLPGHPDHHPHQSPALPPVTWTSVGPAQYHATVLGAALGRGVVSHWLGLAKTLRAQARSGHTTIDQVLQHRLCTTLGQLLVVGFGAHGVGVTFDHARRRWRRLAQ